MLKKGEVGAAGERLITVGSIDAPIDPASVKSRLFQFNHQMSAGCSVRLISGLYVSKSNRSDAAPPL